MAFNPNNYKAPEVKKLPVILLLDVSGSMQGAKIDSLYNATCDMIDTFVGAQLKEQSIDVAIITFGNEIKLHTPYTPVKELQDKGLEQFKAEGMTPMGTAIQMAKDMIDDKSVTPSRIYRPAVVLVSDGEPNDEWRGPMAMFINDGRSAKCQRFAVAIGDQADRTVLETFTENPDNVFFAANASDLADCFKTVSMSVTSTATKPDAPKTVTDDKAPAPTPVKQDDDDGDDW
ncbi:vWA domain-containing protein [Pseudobutyrivibrio xylanivorans]|uniref:VWA domain-containing protein n=1 Tax=Pseudobutyrivibrio xylanivorans TaxID=185007 RepID=A0A5P6VRR6_PSEXY|nr:VWA domain-containing protein [Pseudobutyrivibrio xylanivorans]QFJ55276.1 VWA domain-containing protein [Pseudobutyrivibrio xylanivorans]